MNLRVSLALGAAVAVAAAGWTAHVGRIEAPSAAPVARSGGPSSAVPIAVPVAAPTGVTRLSDGRVSVHLDRVSVDTLVEALARAGVALPGDDASPAPARPAAARAAAGDRASLSRSLRIGDDAERAAALLAAEELGVSLEAGLLRDLYEADPSDRVRLLAFAAYLDAVAGDRDAVRTALEGGAYNSSTAVQAEAHRRVGELVLFDQAVATTPAQ